uniref:Uncharacterized protein n=1 Tax=Paenibacillus athensensis TaxID=1967502 RepID=A0A4Y8Q313_9BACL
MGNISYQLTIAQKNNALFEAGSMPGFCILLAKIAFLTEFGKVDIKNQPGKKEHLPPRHLIQQMYAGIAQKR